MWHHGVGLDASATRRNLISIIAILVVTGGCSGSDGVINSTLGETILGSGVPAQEDRPVSGCTRVLFATAGDLYIEMGAQEALRVEAEDNLLPYLETVVSSATLRITTESGVDLRPTLPIEFYFTATSLDGIVHSGVGAVEADDLSLADLSVTHTGVGEIRLERLDTSNLSALMSGVGNLNASGAATSVEATISGVGDYVAENLSSVDTRVLISGLGSATVRASGTLEVTFSGTGSVYYYGDPTLTVHGTGNVVRLGP